MGSDDTARGDDTNGNTDEPNGNTDDTADSSTDTTVNASTDHTADSGTDDPANGDEAAPSGPSGTTGGADGTDATPADALDARYLAAKRTVDERAANRRVREELLDRLMAGPVVYDAGAGTGTLLARLLDWGVTPSAYEAVDRNPVVVDHGVQARADELAARGIEVNRDANGERGFRAGNTTVQFTADDVLTAAPETADLVVAASLLDLVSVGDAFAQFERTLGDGGMVYAPATFDGGTFFAPTHPADELVTRVFHESIRAQPDRTPEAGRGALSEAASRGWEVIAVGSADWIVGAETDPSDDRTPRGTDEPGGGGESDRASGETRPSDDVPADGGYPNDERYFLDSVLGFVADSLVERSSGPLSNTERVADLPLTDTTRERLAETNHEPDAIHDWLQDRREALADGRLVYVAHQLDLLFAP